ncbi:hypothetical protein [uncultured Imperialibacter sp.]|tara:strand:- start:1254 stop:1394 length:141 start_codon:yes stop_codon:yes gene_type:complete
MFAKLLAKLSGHGADTELETRTLTCYPAEVTHEEKNLFDYLLEIGS